MIILSIKTYQIKQEKIEISDKQNQALRSSANLKTENIDECCFLPSTLVHPYLCEKSHPKRVSIYVQYIGSLKIQRFDFNIGFKCNEVHKIVKLSIISTNIFELIFYQVENKWELERTLIEILENFSWIY